MKLILSITFIFNTFLFTAQNFSGSVMLSNIDDVDIILDIEIDNSNDLVTFNLTGPEGRFIGVGFNAQTMSEAPYIFISQESTVQERKLNGQYDEGAALDSEITIVSDETNNGVRSIIFTRPITIDDTNYYDFSSITDGTSLSLIWSIGRAYVISQHIRRGSTVVTFSNETLSNNDITQRNDSSYVRVFPNPVTDELHVDNVDKLKSITIYNMAHQQVANFSNNSLNKSIDMKSFSSGTYFVKVTGLDGTYASEIVIKK